jgi:hypothetical protein
LIPGYDGYEASDLGRVRSVNRYVTQLSRGGKLYRRCFAGRILRQTVPKDGYPKVSLGFKQNVHVHIVVMLAFRGPPPSGHWVAHDDGDEGNAKLSNLRYDTPSGNHLDKRRHGTDNRGDRHWRRKAA